MTFDIDKLPSQEGRLAVITGANTGLGFENAKYFAGAGMKVVMACRSEDRARDAISRIKADIKDADLVFMQIDLSDLSSVRRFADDFSRQYDRLDLLINNAGIMWTPYEQSVDGFEGQMAANYFGHYLLTSLLLDYIPNEPEARIVSLSSIAHTQIKRIRFHDIHWEKKYNKFGAYAQTKLACLMFAIELQRRLEQAGWKTLSVAAHPGISDTELVRTLKPWQISLIRHTIGPFFTHPPAEGAIPQVMAALDPEVRGGEYLGPQGFREFSGPSGEAKIKPWAQDPDANKQLWEVSAKLTGAAWPSLA
jgi:NAD(P)-dependent dehydrogenase (short-subunit alcohol dehydrogenase family)